MTSRAASVAAGLALLVVASASLVAQSVPSRPVPKPARTLVAEALAAQGGETRLRAIRSLTLDAIGHGWALEQSERPEGPWLSSYSQTKEVRDLANGRRYLELQRRDWNAPSWSPAAATVIADGVVARTNGQRWAAGLPTALDEWADVQAFAPERLLLTAAAAPDLSTAPDAVRQGVPQHVVRFTHGAAKVALYLNAYTHLPTELEIVKDDRFGIWGDVTERRAYGFWTLERGGIMYPRQTTTTWNGYPFADETVHGLTFNEPVDETKFAIPDTARAAYRDIAQRPMRMGSLTLDSSKAVEVAPNIVEFQAGYNVAVVNQPDGLVLIEATTSEAFMAQAVAVAQAKFPGKAVKAVITTSDAWPHIGGVRSMVARGVPVYALDLNLPILSRLIKAPRTLAPDALAKAPKAPVFRAVSTRTTIGTGDTRLEIIPVRGETGERMMLIWFPAARVLYTSDLIQRDRTGESFFMIEMPAEVVDAAARERLDGITTAFGMHLPPTPWSKVTAAVDAARR